MKNIQGGKDEWLFFCHPSSSLSNGDVNASYTGIACGKAKPSSKGSKNYCPVDGL